MSPELSSAFPESVRAAEGDKEVVAYQQPQPLPYQRPVDGSGKGNGRRVLGMKSKWFYGLLVLLVALAIGLGVGLGVGLGTRDSGYVYTVHFSGEALASFDSRSCDLAMVALSLTWSSSTSPASTATTSSATPSSPTGVADPYAIGGAINPEYYTTRGAFNGSGIALASQSFSSDLSDAPLGSLVMYFQHNSGDIRFERLTADGDWVGGSQSEIVASNAKNSTPLSAVAYVQNGTSQWHVFCKTLWLMEISTWRQLTDDPDIGNDNKLKQRSNSNTTSFWSDGPLTDMDLTVLDADQVGMQACWYGNAYGDTDYVHTDRPSTGSTAASAEYGRFSGAAANEDTRHG